MAWASDCFEEIIWLRANGIHNSENHWQTVSSHFPLTWTHQQQTYIMWNEISHQHPDLFLINSQSNLSSTPYSTASTVCLFKTIDGFFLERNKKKTTRVHGVYHFQNKSSSWLSRIVKTLLGSFPFGREKRITRQRARNTHRNHDGRLRSV